MKILIVEDEALVGMLLKQMLNNLGYDEVMTVMRGKDALFQVEKENYDLVLLDIGLPDISGFEVLEKINNMEKGVKCFFVTARSDNRTIRKIGGLRCEGVMSKPVDESMLKELFENLK